VSNYISKINNFPVFWNFFYKFFFINSAQPGKSLSYDFKLSFDSKLKYSVFFKVFEILPSIKPDIS